MGTYLPRTSIYIAEVSTVPISATLADIPEYVSEAGPSLYPFISSYTLSLYAHCPAMARISESYIPT
jgi:hypothetical protein